MTQEPCARGAIAYLSAPEPPARHLRIFVKHLLTFFSVLFAAAAGSWLVEELVGYDSELDSRSAAGAVDVGAESIALIVDVDEYNRIHIVVDLVADEVG